MWQWRMLIGLAAVVQIAAGIAFFVLTRLRDAAPFGLALLAGVGLLSVAALVVDSLGRVAAVANILIAILVALGLVPMLITLAAGYAPPEMATYAVANSVLAASSACSSVGLRRLRLVGSA